MSTVVKVSKVSGRGVFATKNIRKGETFLVNPLLITKKKDFKSLSKTDISNYWYEWNRHSYAIAMGNGSFFNHSSDANTEYEVDVDSKEIFFTAAKPIRKNEEIFINYNGEASCKNKVWFEK